MVVPPRPHRFGEPVAASLEELVPPVHFYRHLEVKLALGFVRSVGSSARIDREHTGSIHIHGKGCKERTVTHNCKVCRALRNYMQIRSKLDEDALSLTKFGLPIGPRSIENIVAKNAAAAGITDASLHTLPHTFATHHVRKGTSLTSVRAARGHENLATTSLYVDLAREQMDIET